MLANERKCSTCSDTFVSQHSTRCRKCVLDSRKEKKVKKAEGKARLLKLHAVVEKLVKQSNLEKVQGKNPKSKKSRKKIIYLQGSAADGSSHTTAKTLRKKLTILTCVLCGMPIKAGGMLEHKKQAHGEARITPSYTNGIPCNIRPVFFSGGLPSLGKRR